MNPPSIFLPDEIVTAVRTFANASITARRAMAHSLQDFMAEVPYGAKMQVYELIAHEWNDATGDQITARTIRHWMHSVTDYSKADLEKYQNVTDAQLIEAVSLANVAKVSPQQILEWCEAEQVLSVPTMRAHWLPQTGTPYETDHPGVSALLRSAEKHFSQHPRWPEFLRIVNDLRKIIKEMQGTSK